MTTTAAIARVGIAASVVLAAGAAAFHEPATYRFGGAFQSEVSDGPAQCRQRCADTPGCMSWSYIQPGIRAVTAVCELKAAVGEAEPNPCCISGLHPNLEPNARFSRVVARPEPAAAPPAPIDAFAPSPTVIRPTQPSPTATPPGDLLGGPISPQATVMPGGAVLPPLPRSEPVEGSALPAKAAPAHEKPPLRPTAH